MLGRSWGSSSTGDWRSGPKAPWSSLSEGITSADGSANDWEPEQGFKGAKCFDSSNCSSGFRCSGGECVKIPTSDPEADPGQNNSPTTDGGCGTGGTGGGGGSNYTPGSPYRTGTCGTSTGSPGGCTKSTCSNTGYDGNSTNLSSSASNCGDECCSVEGGVVVCRPGRCDDGRDDPYDPDNPNNDTNDSSKRCDGFCDDYQSANGLSFGDRCEELTCNECTECQNGRCRRGDSIPCHCNNKSCGHCEVCDTSVGECKEADECRLCREGPVTCSGNRSTRVRACGGSEAELERNWNEAIAEKCTPKDNSGQPNKNCRVARGRNNPPVCPNGYKCQNVGVIQNDDTGERIYLQMQCRKDQPDSPDEADDWPLDGDYDGDGWDDGWWDRVNDRCDGLGEGSGFSCQPGSICAISGNRCIDDPNVPGNMAEDWRLCQIEGELCPDGSCCRGGKGCSPVSENGSFGCCNSEFVPRYKTTFRYPTSGATFKVTTEGEPVTGASYGSGFCTRRCSSSYGSGYHVTYSEGTADSGIARPCGSTSENAYGGTETYDIELDRLSNGTLIRLMSCECAASWNEDTCDEVPVVTDTELIGYVCQDED